MSFPPRSVWLLILASTCACSALIGIDDRRLVDADVDGDAMEASSAPAESSSAPSDTSTSPWDVWSAPADAAGGPTEGSSRAGQGSDAITVALGARDGPGDDDGGREAVGDVPDAWSTTGTDPSRPDAVNGGGTAPCVSTVGAVTDFYVDPSGDAGPCGFTTITAAVSAARQSTAPAKTVHLAAGTYSAQGGEQLPIEIRGGVSLVGAGAGASVISGAGPTNLTPPTNAYGDLVAISLPAAALLVGDPTSPTVISDLSIVPGPASRPGMEGVYCDQGNASAAAPTPNTTLRDVTVDGFEVAMRVTWSPAGSGCNALLTSSVLENGAFGVIADGLANEAGDPLELVSVELEGNTFRNFAANDQNTLAYFNGAGLATIDAVEGVVVHGNRFLQDPGGGGQIGIWAVQQSRYGATGLDVEDNEFGPLTNAGIVLIGNASIDRLVGNSFHDISMQSAPPNVNLDFLGVGLALYQFLPGTAPVLALARGNTFLGNDIGVTFRSNQASPTPFQVDFGEAADAGGNVFRCNAAPTKLSMIGAGGDLVVQLPASPIVLLFEGNVWDHAPPTLWVGESQTSAPVGIDINLFGTAAPDAAVVGASVDLAGGSATNTPPCPMGRSSGP